MALRSPTLRHSYWGSYADPAALAALVGDPRLETGDTAYSESDSTLYAFDGNTSAWNPAGGGGGGGITALTLDAVASGTGSVAATVQGMGGTSSKTHFVIEGGKFATVQAAINAAADGDVIVVGPKANAGSWGPAVFSAQKRLALVGLGPKVSEYPKIDSVTFSPTTGANILQNTVYVRGMFIYGDFSASNAVTFGGTALARLRLQECYIYGTGASGTLVSTSNAATSSGTSSTLYIDNCTIQTSAFLGTLVDHVAGYTFIKNGTIIEGGLNALKVTAGTVECFNTQFGTSVAGNGTIRVDGGIATLSYCRVVNDNATGIGAYLNAAFPASYFGAGSSVFLVGGSSPQAGAVCVTGVSAAAYYLYSQVTYGTAAPTVSVVTGLPSTQEAATGDLSGNYPNPTVAKIQGRAVSTTAPTPSQVLTWNGSAWAPATPTTPVTSVTATSPVTSSGGTTPVIALGTVGIANGGTGVTTVPANGRLLIGNGTGYTSANLTAGSGISITNASGAITIANSGVLAPAGSSGQIQYNNGGSLGGAANVTISSNDLVLAESASPTAPANGAGVKLVAQPLATRDMLVVSTQGYPYFVQPHLGKTKVGSWVAYGNNTVLPIGDGMPAPLNSGTLTARTVVSTNFVTALRRIGTVGNTTGGSNTGLYMNTLLFLRGTTSTMGGFHFVIRFVIADAGAITQGANGVGMFVGLCGTTTGLNATNSQSVGGSGVLNSLGLGADYADSQMTFMYNGASGTATKVVLNGGTGFPCNGQSTDAYELAMWAPPGGSIVYFQATNLVSGVSASGSASGASLVAQSQTLAIQMMKFNQAAVQPAAAPGIDLVSCYIESGY